MAKKKEITLRVLRGLINQRAQHAVPLLPTSDSTLLFRSCPPGKEIIGQATNPDNWQAKGKKT